jgi:hypothetical protein
MANRTKVVLTVIVATAMLVEWKLAASMGEAYAKHAYHGMCNGGVGQPYADFIHRLRVIAESGDSNRLTIVLQRADERSRDIYDVWLAERRDAYKMSIYKILK